MDSNSRNLGDSPFQETLLISCHLVVLVCRADIVKPIFCSFRLNSRTRALEHWNVGRSLASCPVDEEHLGGEGTSCHDRHLDSVLRPRPPQVRHQLELPEDDAGREEEEETGEEDGEEDKKIDMQLVLSEEYVSESGLDILAFGTVENEVELCGSEVVRGLRKVDDQPVLDILDIEHFVGVGQCGKCGESVGVHLSHRESFPRRPDRLVGN